MHHHPTPNLHVNLCFIVYKHLHPPKSCFSDKCAYKNHHPVIPTTSDSLHHTHVYTPLEGEKLHSKCISKPFLLLSKRCLNPEIRLQPEKSHPCSPKQVFTLSKQAFILSKTGFHSAKLNHIVQNMLSHPSNRLSNSSP